MISDDVGATEGPDADNIGEVAFVNQNAVNLRFCLPRWSLSLVISEAVLEKGAVCAIFLELEKSRSRKSSSFVSW